MKVSVDQKIIFFTATFSLTEIGLGSLLHSLKVPFTGHFLSLNQAFLLSILSLQLKNKDRLAGFEVSTATAILKSLAPAGKKLTPMLAISAQGLLHNIGTLTLGRNFFGLMIANILCGLWAFIQPWVIYYILYAKDLFAMAEYFMRKLSPVIEVSFQDIGIAISVLIIIKSVLAIFVTYLVFKLPEDTVLVYISKLSNRKKVTIKKDISVTRGVVKDITSPLFIFSFLLMSIFYYFTGTDMAETIWKILRPLALAIFIFTFLRMVPLENIAIRLEKMGLKRLGHIVQLTLQKINRDN